MRLDEVAEDLDSLERRVQEMEKMWDSPVARAAAHCERAGVKSAVFKWVPEDYYSRPMQGRAEVLGCFEEQMCKSLVMENAAYNSKEAGPNESRFYLVVVQYAAKLNADKLRRAIQRLAEQQGTSSPAAASRYNFQLATAEDNDRLTGFTHNAVTPFGLATPLPVVLSEAILDVRPRFIWMGAGHVHCKLGCRIEEFIRALDPIIANVSDPRTDAAIED